MATKAERLASDIGRRIESGELAPGERLPTMAEMTRVTGVAGTTVQTAYGILRDRGLIHTVHGQGSFVREPKVMFTRNASTRYVEEKGRAGTDDPERLGVMIAEMDSPRVKRSDVEVDSMYFDVDADQVMAEKFGIEVGDRLLERIYQTRVSAKADHMNVVTSYVPLVYIEGNPELLDADNEPWPGGTMHQLRTVGIEIAKIVDDVIARPPTMQEADALDLESGVAVLQITKTSIDTEGRVVEISTAVYPGDRTQLSYTTELPRW